MVIIADLWLSIVLATILCFIAGSILHMMVPFYRSIYNRLPDENALLSALKGVPPGFYMFPFSADPNAMKDPAFVQKLEQGPTGMLNVFAPRKWSMGPYLFKQLLFHLLVSGAVAYVARLTISAGADYYHVFRVTGTVAFLAYTTAIFPGVIWYREPGNLVATKIIDGVVWGMLTAGSFAGFWPG